MGLFGERALRPVDRLGDGSAPQAEEDAAFWASPVGMAARARLRGDRFFQVELDDATLTAYAEAAAGQAHDHDGRRARRTCDLLGQIEELGWHLEHVSWWRAGDDRPLPRGAAGVVPAAAEPIRGVYLFHAVDATDLAEPSAHHRRGDHARPSHRRDVAL
jgi:hypothetical protein